MPAPPCTQNRLYLGPLFPSLWGSAPKQTHPLKCPPERRFAPARLPHSAPLNTAKVAASSDRASLPPVPACSQSCSPNSRAQALPLQLWLQSFRSLQIASCSFSFPSCRRMCPQLLKARRLACSWLPIPRFRPWGRADAATANQTLRFMFFSSATVARSCICTPSARLSSLRGRAQKENTNLRTATNCLRPSMRCPDTQWPWLLPELSVGRSNVPRLARLDQFRR